MNRTDVTTEGQRNQRPMREAVTGATWAVKGHEDDRLRRSDRPLVDREPRPGQVVPPARPTSYYGRPILKEPTWKAKEIAGYFFLGGLAGASSTVAAVADLTGRPHLARGAKVAAALACGGSIYALIKDLGVPRRFPNMIRVVKPTSPMNVGSWLLAAYVPSAGAAAATAVTRRFRRVGGLATAAAALLGPAVASYTGAILGDTAVPAWHDGHRELPVVFAASGASAAAGLGLLVAPTAETAPVRRLAAVATALEIGGLRVMERRMGDVARPYHEGRAGQLLQWSERLGAGGAVAAVAVAGRSRPAAAAAGAALLAASALTRFGVFEAGVASARDPDATTVPQRRRLADRR